MNDPPSTTVVGSDEQRSGASVGIDVDRWCRLAGAVLADERRRGELTLTFVDLDEIAALNAEHLGHEGPTDVLSFPLDAADGDETEEASGVPVLLGDVVVCPAVAAAQAAEHAGTLDDELALLVVHGVLHVLGHDHAEADETAVMRTRELAHLRTHHWGGSPPAGFRQIHDDASAAGSRRSEVKSRFGTPGAPLPGVHGGGAPVCAPSPAASKTADAVATK